MMQVKTFDIMHSTSEACYAAHNFNLAFFCDNFVLLSNFVERQSAEKFVFDRILQLFSEFLAQYTPMVIKQKKTFGSQLCYLCT